MCLVQAFCLIQLLTKWLSSLKFSMSIVASKLYNLYKPLTPIQNPTGFNLHSSLFSPSSTFLSLTEGKLEETCNIYFISSQGCIKSNMGACASAPKGLKAEFHAAAAPARAPAPLPEKVEAKVEEVEEKKADGDGKEKVMDENSNNNTSKNDIEIGNGSKQPHQSLGSLLHGVIIMIIIIILFIIIPLLIFWFIKFDGYPSYYI